MVWSFYFNLPAARLGADSSAAPEAKMSQPHLPSTTTHTDREATFSHQDEKNLLFLMYFAS